MEGGEKVTEGSVSAAANGISKRQMKKQKKQEMWEKKKEIIK